MAGSRQGADDHKVDLSYAPQISGGDELRNINCYEYLLYIAGKIQKDHPDMLVAFRGLFEFFSENPSYRSDMAYGDLYTLVLEVLEIELDKLSAQPDSYQKALKNNAEMIRALYLNSNLGLERAAAMISSSTSGTTHASSHTAKEVRRRLTASSDTQVNQITPQQLGSLLGRARTFFDAVIRGEFKPQLSTSMASIRRYDYTNIFRQLPNELRFGTQGEFHQGRARVSPLFEAWLRVTYGDYAQIPSANLPSSTTVVAAAAAAAATVASPASAIDPVLSTSSQLSSSVESTFLSGSGVVQAEEARTRPYIYINNLGLDRDSIEGRMERELTLALHDLELRHPQIAVITLPADKGLLDLSSLNKHQKEMTYDGAFWRMLDVAMDRSSEKVKDFYISGKMRGILFGDDLDNQKSRFESLLINSFSKLGFKPGDKLTPAEFHAVYFHFIKFELTNYILTKLNPDAFNISCKDAIDRGGVSSAYYNLVKSIEMGSPMSKEEFLRALHAAPALVKGRAINHHAKAIWNALNQYVQYADKSTIPTWLPAWIAENRLLGTRQDFIVKLEAYIESRRNEAPSPHTLFGSYQAAEKISAATKLLSLLKGEITDFAPSQKERGALNDGRLGELVEGMRSYGVLEQNKFKPDRESSYPLGPAGF